MTWGLASYETRFRWVAAIWAVLLTGWCAGTMSWSWRIALLGALLWVAITVLLSLRFAWWRPRGARDVPIFLLLGRLGPDSQPQEFLPAEGLERLIKNLLVAGYRFQTVSEAIDEPTRKSVAMCFDGGARTALNRLLPLLQKYGVRATLFATDRGVTDSRRLKPLELQELLRSGMLEIGGSVEDLGPEASEEAWAAEVVRVRHWLAGVLGALPNVFAYPEGIAPERLKEAVKAAGYHAAMTEGRVLRPVKADPFAIRRRSIPMGCKPWQAYLLATRGRFSALSTPAK